MPLRNTVHPGDDFAPAEMTALAGEASVRHAATSSYAMDDLRRWHRLVASTVPLGRAIRGSRGPGRRARSVSEGRSPVGASDDLWAARVAGVPRRAEVVPPAKGSRRLGPSGLAPKRSRTSARRALPRLASTSRTTSSPVASRLPGAPATGRVVVRSGVRLPAAPPACESTAHRGYAARAARPRSGARVRRRRCSGRR